MPSLVALYHFVLLSTDGWSCLYGEVRHVRLRLDLQASDI